MRNIITSCFFTGKTDPQRFAHLKNDFSLISDWYESIMSLGINAILFYDNLDNETVNKYSNQNIQFVKDDSYEKQNFSAAEHRWTLYKEYFTNNRFDNIFATDCTDLLVRQDPFGDINFLINQDNFFIGKENNPRTNRLSQWMLDQFNYCYPNDPTIRDLVLDKAILNCGIVGGKYENFIKVTSLMSEEILRISPTEQSCRKKNIPFTIDMGVLNYIGYKHIGDHNIVSDEPVHSLYKSYEENRGDVWFIHK